MMQETNRITTLVVLHMICSWINQLTLRVAIKLSLMADLAVTFS